MFTALVLRNAESMKLTRHVRKYIGFVPLFHIRGKKEIATDLSFRFDFDGLAALQGRAIDLGVFIEKQIAKAASGLNFWGHAVRQARVWPEE